MTRYLLDTNVWIDLLKRTDTGQAKRLKATPASEMATCSIIWAELLHGALKYERSAERIFTVSKLLQPYVSLPFDDEAAAHYAEIRHELERRGKAMSSNDLMIASIARQQGLVLVTHDRAFARVAGLDVEDWRSS